jgi:hypothetical protein
MSEHRFTVDISIRGRWVPHVKTLREEEARTEARRLSRDYRRTRALRLGGPGRGRRETVAGFKDGAPFQYIDD